METEFTNHTADQTFSRISSSVLDLCKNVGSSQDTPAMFFDESQRKNVQALFSSFLQGNFFNVIEFAKRIPDTERDPLLIDNFLGEANAELGYHLAAVFHFGKVVSAEASGERQVFKQKILPLTYNNLAISYKKLGFTELAKKYLNRAIKIKPNFSDALNNLGCTLNDEGNSDAAKTCFLEALSIDERDPNIYWNMQSICSNQQIAKELLSKCISFDREFYPAIFTLAGIHAIEGDRETFEQLMNSPLNGDPILQSFEWILSLDHKPKLLFNRWDIFDLATSLSVPGRPCYEFGVWMGQSLGYLMRSFDKGFGFDSFEGLPEAWGTLSKGSYSSFSQLPDIPGVDFVVGEFKNSLPKFFAEPREMAGVINFDADLYSATKCALENSASIIDEHSILLFDEYIANEDWQNDEFRAFNEFCSEKGCTYEVLAVSVFTKQVACKIVL